MSEHIYTYAYTQWERLGQAKICVNCPTGAEMEEIERKAVSKGLVTYFVTDAGRTQIPAGSRTVCVCVCVCVFVCV
jgi:PTH2 family peptidyl-tRNA hydrolase